MQTSLHPSKSINTPPSKNVLSGLLIMEPNMKRWNGIRRRRPGTKRISSWSGFTLFRCHGAVYLRVRERERERKRESNTSQPNYKEKKKKGKVICMKNA